MHRGRDDPAARAAARARRVRRGAVAASATLLAVFSGLAAGRIGASHHAVETAASPGAPVTASPSAPGPASPASSAPGSRVAPASPSSAPHAVSGAS